MKLTRTEDRSARFRRFAVAMIAVCIAAVALPHGVMAQLAEALDHVDDLIDTEDPDAALAELNSLESSATTPEQRAEVYWRMASATLMRGDQRKDAGADDAELLDIYGTGESYGVKAVEADRSNYLGYYWQSANVGRWGQVKGVLNSLFRASDMRDLLTEAITLEPDHPESYYVLGQLYAKVPGMISFGNVEYAVSLARKSVDLMEEEIRRGDREEASEAFYVQLASHLIDRGWNDRKRSRSLPAIQKKYNGASTPIERGFYYEGSVSIPDGDDKSEAAQILDGVIARLGGRGSLSPSERRHLEEAQELRSKL
ncbi:MAG: hypothetical protein WCY01_07095 [Alkalispirochaeta sp.]